MIILLFGNIGSGKTTLANELKKELGYEYLAIDDFRRKFGDNTVSGEHFSRDSFIAQSVGKSNVIIELLGVGTLTDKLFELLKKNLIPKLVAVLDVPREICLSRLDSRIWDIPFPGEFGSFQSILENTHQKLIIDKGYEKWLKMTNCRLEVFDNSKKSDIKKNSRTIKQIVNETEH
jgi:deoxyadenosine/deoxycytidine kinase